MKYLPILFVLLLAACSSAPVQQPSQYLLRSPALPATGLVDTVAAYDLALVEVASYLDQPGLMLETDSGEIHTARLHQWAEPLRLSLPGFMAAEIGREIGARVSVRNGDINATRIEISIDQLHGTRSGTALLVANWRCSGADGQVMAGQFAEEQTLSRDGYAALVQAQRSLLQGLARDIGAALKQ